MTDPNLNKETEQEQGVNLGAGQSDSETRGDDTAGEEKETEEEKEEEEAATE